jgi:hypothetical protein
MPNNSQSDMRPTLFSDCVSLRLKRTRKENDSSPHGRIMQTRSTTRYDREAEEPEMEETPDLSLPVQSL